jgi:ribonucleotide reductase beta subunit family protein with ferritin-like domain
MTLPFTINPLSLINDEILFTEDPTRKTIRPVLYPAMWSSYKKMQGSTWTAEEINYQSDITDLNTGRVSDEVMHIVKYVLGFFSGADTIVNENLALNFINKVKILEAQIFYGLQIANENVHAETYAVLIDVLISDKKEKERVLNAISTMPCVGKLYSWVQRWIHCTAEQEQTNNVMLQDYMTQGASDEVVDDLAYIWCEAKRLVAFACVEGIMFSSAFAIIFWIKEKSILPGLTFSNELISRDEGIHRDFACLLYSNIRHKPPTDQVTEIISDAVAFQDEFIEEMLAVRQTGMNKEDMKEYVRFVADNLCSALNVPVIYKARNPFSFMDKISFNGVTNFFEKRVGEYSLSGFEEGADDKIVLGGDY